MQQTITVHELRSYRIRVKARVDKNASNPLWGILAERWAKLVEIARSTLDASLGKAMNRYEREGYSEIARLADNIEAREVVETVAAMYLLQEERPRRFESDTAFRAQLVRRVRGLARMNFGEYFDNKTGRTKRVYRDAKPKTTACLAECLNAAFGGAGLAVARLEKREADSATNERATLHAALEALE